MGINIKERNKILTFGAIAGAGTYYLLQWMVMPLLNFFSTLIPTIGLKFAEANGGNGISIAIRDSLTGIDGALSGWLVDALGLTVQSNLMMNTLMAAAGGAILFLSGAYIADKLNWLKGNAEQKTRVVIFTGSALAAFIIGGMAVPAIGIDLMNTLIAFGINAAILAWVYVAIDKQMKLGLIPF